MLDELYFENFKAFKEEEARQMEAAEAAHRQDGRGVSVRNVCVCVCVCVTKK